MAEKNLVEETLIQIQNLEEVINENAKEILASTMKEEISELVKESMKQDETDKESEFTEEMTEADEEDETEEIEMDFDTEEDSDESEELEDSEDEMEMDLDMDDEMEMDSDLEDETDVIDLTSASDEEILKVFKSMSAEDEITVTKDGDYIHLTDEDDEYLIQTEGELETELEEGWESEEEQELEESDWGGNEHDFKRRKGHKIGDVDGHYKDYESDEELEETIYEISFDDSEDFDSEEEYDFEEDLEDFDEKSEFYSEMEESTSIHEKYDHKKGSKSVKPKVGKGAKTGSASKFSYKNNKGGFKEEMPKADPTKFAGKVKKFEFKETDLSAASEKEAKAFASKKSETKEASRTYGMGWRKDALPKGARAGSKQARMRTESVMDEVEMLRSKNEEYRKALNLFREKLNEVAVFNSNLAYATRLFTEHSTSKQEKINILRRFDSAETLKESKALYKTIKDELLSDNTVTKSINESIERVIEREPQSGSAINLIESKTYENPQFLRMKDIMAKIAK